MVTKRFCWGIGFWLSIVVATGASVSRLVAAPPASAAAKPQSASELSPGERHLPAGKLGEVIRLGRELVDQTTTHPLSRKYAGNALNCSSCHLKSGTDPRAASFLGVATAYPAWSPREQRVITLEDRILNCFMRSGNGVRPPLGGEISVSIAAYITWLSAGEPIQQNAERPVGPRAVSKLSLAATTADAERGEAIYQKRCAECHGKDGQGDERRPPLWGKRSYNDGAGFAQNAALAAWLHIAMPLNKADLTKQEALDVAAAINRHERPRFRLEEHLPEAARLGEYNAAAAAAAAVP